MKVTENHENLKFTFVQWRSRIHSPQIITDTDFADDIAIFSDTLKNTALLLRNIEIAAKEVCLLITEKKTENLNGIIQ